MSKDVYYCKQCGEGYSENIMFCLCGTMLTRVEVHDSPNLKSSTVNIASQEEESGN